MVVNINNGVAHCSGFEDCKVNCDYGFISNGTYSTSLENIESTYLNLNPKECQKYKYRAGVACVRPVVAVVGGYNKAWDHSEVFPATTELYSMSSLRDCDYALPDLPVGRKGMFGGWAGGRATVCGGEDREGRLYEDCLSYSFQDQVWLSDAASSAQLGGERSYAAAALVDSCLLVSGGRTGLGVTDSLVGLAGSCLDQYPSLPRPTEGHCMVQVGEELVVVGGGPESYGSTQVLSLRSLQWREGRPPQKDRALHDCSLVVTAEGEGVLVAGNDFSPSDLAEIYYPATDSWVWTPGWMNNERTGAATTILGGRPTVISGYGGDYCCKEFYTTAESYDQNSGQWWILHSRSELRGEGRVLRTDCFAGI